MLLDCSPACNDRLRITHRFPFSFAVRVNWFDFNNRSASCGLLVSQLGIFQNPEHIQKVRGALGPNTPLYQICSLALEVPEGSAQQQAIVQVGEKVTPGLDLWCGLWKQCRMVCMFYIHALVCTSDSIDTAKLVLEDIVMAKYRRDYQTTENPFGLLWAFTYALQLSHPLNRRAAQMVYEALWAMRGLDDIQYEKIDRFLVLSLFYPSADLKAIVDNLGIWGTLMENNWRVGYVDPIAGSAGGV